MLVSCIALNRAGGWRVFGTLAIGMLCISHRIESTTGLTLFVFLFDYYRIAVKKTLLPVPCILSAPIWTVIAAPLPVVSRSSKIFDCGVLL